VFEGYHMRLKTDYEMRAETGEDSDFVFRKEKCCESVKL
jgi:hypothetical protein